MLSPGGKVYRYTGRQVNKYTGDVFTCVPVYLSTLFHHLLQFVIFLIGHAEIIFLHGELAADDFIVIVLQAVENDLPRVAVDFGHLRLELRI